MRENLLARAVHATWTRWAKKISNQSEQVQRRLPPATERLKHRNAPIELVPQDEVVDKESFIAVADPLCRAIDQALIKRRLGNQSNRAQWEETAQDRSAETRFIYEWSDSHITIEIEHAGLNGSLISRPPVDCVSLSNFLYPLGGREFGDLEIIAGDGSSPYQNYELKRPQASTYGAKEFGAMYGSLVRIYTALQPVK